MWPGGSWRGEAGPWKVEGEPEAALRDLEEAMEALSKSNLAEDKRAAKKAELQKLVKDIRTSKAVVKKTILEEKKGLAMLPNTNPLYPTFSDAVKIEYEEGRGRFAKREVHI